MDNPTDILDELAWAASAAGGGSLDELKETLQAIEKLRAVPREKLPEELIASLDDIFALADELRSSHDPKTGKTLASLLKLTFCDTLATAPTDTDTSEDDDLLAVYLGASADGLAELEGALLALDAEGDLDALVDAKRSIHTLKGECGVLSLNEAQNLWHQAESMIDKAEEAGITVPVDPLMELLDWHREYLERLREDSKAEAPEFDELLATLVVPRTAADDSTGTNAEAGAGSNAEAGREDTADDEEEEDDDDDNQELVTFPPHLLEDETVPEFITESQVHLEDSEAALFDLDDDPSNVEGIARIFRSFHTIKGVAGFLEIEPVSRIAHSAETLLDQFRQSDIPFGRVHADVVLEAKDMIAKLLDALSGQPGPRVSALEHLIKRTEAMAKDPAGAVGPGPEVAKQAPKSVEIENTEAATPKQEATPPAPASTVDEKKLVPAAKPASKPAAAPKPTGKTGPKRAATDTTIRVNMQRLDSLVDMVGELVIAQQMVVQDAGRVMLHADERLGRNLGHLGKITRDLQEASMSLRMVTFQSTFQKMHRLVRDVAAKASKEVKLKVEGAETEVDRNIVDKISDPLVHLVRNAIDHGLEAPEERVKNGKSANGNVTLSARHQSGSIVISLQDDGGGLVRHKIIAKAQERGLLDPALDHVDLPDSAVHRLIFEPGFSTAAAVTDISGRGVGMDVVRRNIEAMRGRIEILSTEGEGTTFQIHLPLTLAIIDAMVVRAGDERFVIPTLSIVQSFQPSPGDIHGIHEGAPLVEVRGELVPVIPLREAIDQRSNTPLDATDSTLILVEATGQRACLIVDEILGQQQVVIKKLGSCMPTLPAISGGAILGDGRVALIVDTEGVLEQVETACNA